DRQIIFYDQLGSGLSDQPPNNSIWSVQLFLEELAQLREHLKLTRIHLLGHSWGGMLAIEYLLTRPQGVQSVILASSLIDMPLYQEEVEKLKEELPDYIYDALKEHETAGTTDAVVYRRAYQEYKNRHIYRGKAMPAE